jgi:hypothetical protein
MRVLEDFYDDRASVEKLLGKAGRKSPSPRPKPTHDDVVDLVSIA